ncbi:Molybdopterin or thiamine biosynthesis adenylyltransferase [Geoalkalibacter ferrihydriticus]|uniref:Thiamine biosynthesis protein ThiF n=2 Tax=Geoalkalibacter ferrihydriticus TaxID=392333 RepID=A0A0C2HRF4_9BACT|nr:HesA/MoeB/ThiF family protein [Geoalkalibacter ferrihydriticus]KIH75362.1 thiamine biosynthesis protein ThiF [Geoalkalibacter ferrihydriticus DSM 17813]SDM96166.1 Molybdopterin or thiamine biosynthesis adenylyltransferase [Geoalkalibacter ferrihydriticus]
MRDLLEFVRAQTADDLVAWAIQQEAAARFGLPLAKVEEVLLEAQLLPARYQRNRKGISTAQQLKLHRSRVAVIGCGGLGGYVIEELARLGVGTIVAIDPDVFEEHNLNRQMFSVPARLGQSKTTAALERVAEVNPAVTLIPQELAFGRDNGAELLNGCALAVDALDSIRVRLELAEVCDGLGIPMVHGAIAGWYGQVFTQFPGENHLQRIYAHGVDGKGAEKTLGNPSFTPALVASLEVAEACKILIGVGEPLRGRKLLIDLLDMDLHVMPL